MSKYTNYLGVIVLMMAFGCLSGILGFSAGFRTNSLEYIEPCVNQTPKNMNEHIEVGASGGGLYFEKKPISVAYATGTETGSEKMTPPSKIFFAYGNFIDHRLGETGESEIATYRFSAFVDNRTIVLTINHPDGGFYEVSNDTLKTSVSDKRSAELEIIAREIEKALIGLPK